MREHAQSAQNNLDVKQKSGCSDGIIREVIRTYDIMIYLVIEMLMPEGVWRRKG